MTEKSKTDYLDRYEGFQTEIHLLSHFDECSAVSTTHSSKVKMSREDALKAQGRFYLQISRQLFVMDNGARIKILLTIPITITLPGYMFEIYAMVSEIHDNVYLVSGFKNFVELEAEISRKELVFKLLNRSVLVLLVHKEIVKPEEIRYVKLQALFPRWNIRIWNN